jgi:tRNA (guanosine-2'-O-)-methyltransferase
LIQDLISYLSGFVTPERKQKFETVAKERTRYATLVMEDMFQTHNISAVLRSCDCFGVQDVHVIENRNEYVENPEVAMGASKWLDVHRYSKRDNNTINTLRNLKSQGYRIVATTPHTDDVLLNDFDVSKGKFALVFGTEREGITDDVRAEADEFVRIPMYGFTESFNISVSAALCLQHIAESIRKEGVDWPLTANEQDELVLKWLRSNIKNVALVEERFLNSKDI